MANFQLSMLCLAITLVIYFLNKRLYRRFRKLPLMPLVLTPTLLVMLLVFGNISWQNYIGEAHWLLWLLGPATIAFAVPVYDNRAIIKRHWMSLTAGVLTATVVAVTSSVWLRHLLWQRASRSADSLIWWRCLWWSPVCLAWRLATCCFYVSLFAKGWRKVLDSARHLMVPGLRGRMNWVNKKA